MTPSGEQQRPTARQLASWWGPALGWMVLLFGLSASPDLPDAPGGLSDKPVHALAYACLSVLLYRALARGRADGLSVGRGLAAAVLATLYGLGDEWHQAFVPGRTADGADLAADSLGAAAAAVALWTCGIILRRWRGRAD